MGCLSSIEAPLAAIITVVFLVNGLYSTAYKVVESKVPFDENALDTKDMLMAALGIMSLVGICSSRRAFGVFTMLFMLHAFVFSCFHVFHTIALFIQSNDEPCRHLKMPQQGRLADSSCHAVNSVFLVCSVITMIGTALASMAVFVRLTTVVVTVSDLRKMATGRSFDNSMPRLISQKAIESETEEDEPARKIGMADLFV